MKKLLSDLVFWLTIKPHMRGLLKVLPEAKIHPVGSRYVCSPPVLNTDIDLLVWVPETQMHWVKLLNAGYCVSTRIDKYPGAIGKFATWRRGKVNLIVSSNIDFVEGFQTATYICKKYNMLEKERRIIIHAAFRENEYYPASIKHHQVPDEIQKLLATFNGPHGRTLLKAYRAQHKLEL